MDNYKIPDYPVPDPAWDYAGIWGEIWEMKAEIDKTIGYMTTVESPNNGSDYILRSHLEQLLLSLNSALALLQK